MRPGDEDERQGPIFALSALFCQLWERQTQTPSMRSLTQPQPPGLSRPPSRNWPTRARASTTSRRPRRASRTIYPAPRARLPSQDGRTRASRAVSRNIWTRRPPPNPPSQAHRTCPFSTAARAPLPSPAHPTPTASSSERVTAGSRSILPSGPFPPLSGTRIRMTRARLQQQQPPRSPAP
ncbi:hypothetical protein DFH11DRAFT_511630 [Phellopilus nigrolimitatus]|nr:hypothetical protein DFH11DRAFT_511630 [Phellopilus nigrolimitatus]